MGNPSGLLWEYLKSLLKEYLRTIWALLADEWWTMCRLLGTALASAFPLLPNVQFPNKQQIPGCLLLNSNRDITDKDYFSCLLAAKI